MAHRSLPSRAARRRSLFTLLWHREAAASASARRRLQLAHSLEGVVRELHAPVRLPGASPLNRVGLRPHEAEILALAGRLADLDRPVTSAGLSLVHRFVTDGGSPLYDRAAEGAISDVLTDVRDLLEPR